MNPMLIKKIVPIIPISAQPTFISLSGFGIRFANNSIAYAIR